MKVLLLLAVLGLSGCGPSAVDIEMATKEGYIRGYLSVKAYEKCIADAAKRADVDPGKSTFGCPIY